MIPGDLPSNSKKATLSPSTPVLAEYCANMLCSSALCTGLRTAHRGEARNLGGRSAFHRARRNPPEGSRALTVQVVDDLDPGGLCLNGVDDGEVVEHGLDDRHFVVVLPHCPEARSENQSMGGNKCQTGGPARLTHPHCGTRSARGSQFSWRSATPTSIQTA